MNILVCGGAGFIGSWFVKNHLQTYPDDRLVNLDCLTIGSNMENLKDVRNNPNYTFLKGDIRDCERISEIAKDKDVIINFAAQSHVDRSIANPLPFLETNILGTYSILEAARKHNCLFVHVSTDEVYGDAPPGQSFDEDSAIKPSNPYSATKASADHLVASYYRTYGIKCITTRCSNNFGPNQFPEKLVPKTIIRAIKGLKVVLYGDGKQVRSWIHVQDHVAAIESLISKAKLGQVYNITAYNEISNDTITRKILDALGKSHDLIEHTDDRPGHDVRYSVDCTKINSETSWQPKHDFDKALQDTVTWYLDNQDWWEPLIDEYTLHPRPWSV